MRRSLATLSLIVSVSLVAAVPKHAPQKPAAAAKPAIFYDFKGARLGMSLAEWRAMPVLGQNSLSGLGNSVIKFGPVRGVCAGDSGVDSLPMSFRTEAESKANVVVCGYAYSEGIGTTTMWAPASISIGELSASDVEYKFLDDHLYEISVTGNARLLDEVMSGLRAKWGEPTTVVNDTTQNKAGATFPHTVRSWVNPAAIIRVETPFSKIDDLNVSYTTAAGLAKIDAIEKAMNPDINKM